MKIWTISDLHIRQREALDLMKPLQFPEADVCVVAGDVCDSMSRAVNWIGKVIRPVMPVVFVPGNHEFYDTSIEKGRKDAAMIARALDVTLLDDSSAVIDGVRFAGGTLWTDFRLFAPADAAGRDDAVTRAMYMARHGMADFGNIYLQATRPGGPIPRLLKPADTAALHATTLAWLDAELAREHDGPTVVVTHHGPHPNSVHEKYAEDPVTPGFVSDLSPLIERRQPDLWLHGHVHQRFDYEVGRTRVVCNPRGYGMENPEFDFMKTVEIPAAPLPSPDR